MNMDTLGLPGLREQRYRERMDKRSIPRGPTWISVLLAVKNCWP